MSENLRHDPGRQRQRLFISGAPDDRWDDEALGAIKRVKGGDFEVVHMEQLTKE